MVKVKEKDTSADVPFEVALQRLEAIVGQLERGELPLEQTLESFEQGIHLVRLCNERLNQAEQRIQVLTERDGKLILKPLEEERGGHGHVVDDK